MFSLEVYNYLNSDSYLNRDKNYRPNVEEVIPLVLLPHILENIEKHKNSKTSEVPQFKKVYSINSEVLDTLIEASELIEDSLSCEENRLLEEIYYKLDHVIKTITK